MRPAASDVSIDHYRLSRVEYDRAVEAGAFEPDAKVELIDGDLNAMTPEGVSHTTGIDLVADCLRRVFGSGFHVRIQHPLAVDDYSEPEPDVAVVKGTIRDYAETHPRGGGARRRFFGHPVVPAVPSAAPPSGWPREPEC